ENFVIDDDLPLRFLYLDHLAKLGRLFRLPAPDDLGAGLKHTGQFAFHICVAAEHPRARVWRRTCFTRPSIVSSSFFHPSSKACFLTSAERLTPEAISSTNCCACRATRRWPPEPCRTDSSFSAGPVRSCYG